MSEQVKRYYDIIIDDMKDIQPIVREIKEKNTLDDSKNYVRLWKLGNIEHKIYPTEKAFEKLHTLLNGWDGISTIDIVWDDTLSLQVFEI